MPKFQEGDIVIATAVRTIDNLKHGEEYTVLDPDVERIFEDRPVIHVQAASGLHFTLHEYRFTKKEEK